MHGFTSPRFAVIIQTVVDSGCVNNPAAFALQWKPTARHGILLAMWLLEQFEGFQDIEFSGSEAADDTAEPGPGTATVGDVPPNDNS